jgi:hypothetical protein
MMMDTHSQNANKYIYNIQNVFNLFFEITIRMNFAVFGGSFIKLKLN